MKQQYYIFSKPDSTLVLTNSQGSVVLATKSADSTSQLWERTFNGPDGTSEFQITSSADNSALTDDGSGVIALNQVSNAPNQNWEFPSVDGGGVSPSFLFVNAATGNAMQSTGAGSKVIAAPKDSSNANQQWVFDALPNKKKKKGIGKKTVMGKSSVFGKTPGS